MRLYVTGPFFTPYHQALHAENVRRLRQAGHECFLPQEAEQNLGKEEHAPANVFARDLAAIRWSEAIIALLDDPDVSSGTACEMGIFYELTRSDRTKKGILGILTDERPRRRDASNVGESINFFTLGCVQKIGHVCDSVDEALEHLVRWQDELIEEVT